AHEDAEIIFGAVIDESMGEEVRVTVIATGFGAEVLKMAPPPPLYSYQQPAPHQHLSAPTPQYSSAPLQQPQHFAPPAPQPQAYNPMQQPIHQNHYYTQPQAPATYPPQMPPIPPLQAAAPVVETPVEMPAPMTSAPTFQVEELPQVQQPQIPQQQAAPMEQPEVKGSPRDILLAKAKAYREQALRQKEGPAEQLTMEMPMDHSAQQRQNVDLSSPFDQSNLDVPTYLRRKQRSEESPGPN
ncbi:MAG: hypothetical protein K2Q26_16165, partial [Bdellovibrionales bacterium]|nr:hypothetical protein [Bdellovibrionales bacterium]